MRRFLTNKSTNSVPALYNWQSTCVAGLEKHQEPYLWSPAPADPLVCSSWNTSETL
jgi:hypothetical protein